MRSRKGAVRDIRSGYLGATVATSLRIRTAVLINSEVLSDLLKFVCTYEAILVQQLVV